MMVYNGITQFDAHNVEHGCFICVHRAVCEKENLKQHNIVCGNYLCELLIATYAPPITNADRIRAMSDEQLAEWLCGVYDSDNCGVYQDEVGKFINGTTIIDYDQYKLLEWLKKPAEEE